VRAAGVVNVQSWKALKRPGHDVANTAQAPQLAVAVANLSKLHGGEVSAASSGEGGGATFTVRLPLTQKGRPARPAAVR